MTLPEDRQAKEDIQSDVKSALNTAKTLLANENSELSYDYRQRLVQKLRDVLDELD